MVAQFCPNCGKSQQTVPAAKSAAAVPVQPKPAEKKETPVRKEQKSRGNTTVIILLVVVLLLIAALITIFVVGVLGAGKKAEQDAPQNENLGVFEPGDGITVPVVPETKPETEPDLKEETEKEPEPEPEAVACRNCGVAITVDMAVCPYCEWDQSMDPADLEDIPLEVTLGSSDALNPYRMLTVVDTDETSVVSQSGTHDNSAAATIDGDLATSWQEGANGYGIGESVTYVFGGEEKVTGMKLWLGNWREGNWYAENGVPKLLNIYIGETVLTVEFPHSQECFYVVFNRPVSSELVMLEVSSAHPGSKYEDTCIAEVEFYGESEAG